MIFEVLTTASMLGVLGTSFYYKTNSKNNDVEKIMKIAENNKLSTKDEKLRLYRKSYNKKNDFTEYVFKMPLGLSFDQFKEKENNFIDGLNNRSVIRIDLKDLKKLKFDKTLIKQLKKIFLNSRVPLDKQIEIEYDGMLIFRVYNKGLTDFVPYDDEMLKKVGGWEVLIGVTYKEFIKHDFEKMQMFVVAGMTRYGKTVFLKNAITTLINNQSENVRLYLVDLKGGLAFSRFIKCKQVKAVAKDEQETLITLEMLHEEMKTRQQYFLSKGYEDIGEAGIDERTFIVIDEGAEIAGFEDKVVRDRCTFLVSEIARIGAGLGYRLIFATQYPVSDVFPRQVKANTSAALCFKLKNATQSSVVLDEGGAEKLPVGLRGRAIYQTDRKVIVQTPFIDNKFIDIKIKPHITFTPRSDNKNASQQNKKEEQGGTYTTKFEKA
ncbi:FtsK/SpoIIIE domain-containing protein [Bacillus litorisediminis]|uniref:FtsK/SpoIIIE domain-containing protein n=1 Tax=Bacillus litorisediminis TaxID=2922713 RepID=UPI001FAE8ED1|nr:FtsK/SpoIIIE domain-containing protein [Bacillus litorisediminis]